VNPPKDDDLPARRSGAVTVVCDRFDKAWREAFRAKIPLPSIKEYGDNYPNFADELIPELVVIDYQNRRQFRLEVEPAEIYIRQVGDRYEKSIIKGLGEVDGEINVGPAISAADSPDFIPGQHGKQRYRFGELVGKGGFGGVYRARDLHLNREVAIKILNKEQGKCLLEARSLAAAPHQNVVALYDAIEHAPVRYFSGVTVEQPCLVMEFVAGRSLTEQMHIGAMSPQDAVSIALQIAAGVSHAHETGILHSDLKPGNVLLTAGWTVKIADFGLAVNLRAEERPRAGGTLPYMSPEQLAGKEITSRSDIWSLGVILFQMLNEALPFQAETRTGLRYAIQNSAPVAPSDHIPPALANICDRCLQKDPAQRYGSAKDFLEELSRVVSAGENDLAPHRSDGERSQENERQPPHRDIELNSTAAYAGSTSPTGAGNETAKRPGGGIHRRGNAGRLVLGREDETTQIVHELRSGNHPVVVLYGSPGAGKTTLAREVSKQLFESEFTLFQVNLNERDVELTDVMEQVKIGFDLSLDAGANVAAIQVMLRQRLVDSQPSIVIVENFEQVCDIAKQEFLDSIVYIENVKTLITSRTRFSIVDVEPWPYKVEPLAAPSLSDAGRLPVSELEDGFTSVQLFIRLFCDSSDGGQKKRLVKMRDDETVREISRICAMLDGFPGAIECVAKQARLSTSLQRIINRIDNYKQKLRYSEGGGPKADPANCMDVAVRAIYDGLSHCDQQAFLQIVQFNGGFDEDLADGVLEATGDFTEDILARLEANGLLRSRNFDSAYDEATIANGCWDVYLPVMECGRRILREQRNYDAIVSTFNTGVLRSCLEAMNQRVNSPDEFERKADQFRDIFEQAVHTLISGKRKTEAVNILDAMSGSYFARGPAAGLLSLAIDVQNCQHSDITSGAETTLQHLLSNANRLMGDYEHAYIFAKQAASSCRDLSEEFKDLRSRCFIGLATAAEDLGEAHVYQEAIVELERAVDLSYFDSPDTACKAVLTLATGVERVAGFTPAINLLDRADRIALSNDGSVSKECKWRLAANRGQMLWRDGQLEAALAQQECNLLLTHQLMMHDRYLGGCDTNRALTLVDMAEFDSAIEYAHRGRAHLLNADPTWLAVNYATEASAILYAGVHDTSFANQSANNVLHFIANHERDIRNSQYGLIIGLTLALQGEALGILGDHGRARSVLVEAWHYCKRRPGCQTFERFFRISVLLAKLDYEESGLSESLENYLKEAEPFVRHRRLLERPWPVKRTTDLLEHYVRLRKLLDEAKNGKTS